jgi:hypothetical protein
MMLSSIVQDVGERIPHLAGARDHLDVVPVGEDRARAAHAPVDGVRERDPDAVEATRQALATLGLGQPVEVFVLNGELEERRPVTTLRPADRLADGREDVIAPERRQIGEQAPRHVHGVVRRERRPRLMPHPTARPRPSRPRPRATPPQQIQMELHHRRLPAPGSSIRNSQQFICDNQTI